MCKTHTGKPGEFKRFGESLQVRSNYFHITENIHRKDGKRSNKYYPLQISARQKTGEMQYHHDKTCDIDDVKIMCLAFLFMDLKIQKTSFYYKGLS